MVTRCSVSCLIIMIFSFFDKLYQAHNHYPHCCILSTFSKVLAAWESQTDRNILISPSSLLKVHFILKIIWHISIWKGHAVNHGQMQTVSSVSYNTLLWRTRSWSLFLRGKRNPKFLYNDLSNICGKSFLCFSCISPQPENFL